jgi:hypothetical protein
LTFNEISEAVWYLASLGSYSSFQLVSDVFGSVPRPTIGRVERYNSKDLLVLAL